MKKILMAHKTLSCTILTYWFLASPFNGTQEEKDYRYQMSQKVTTTFLEHGISIFAPILYNQLLIQAFEDIHLDDRRKLLMPMNMNFLHRSAGVIFLKVPGWDTSWGIQEYKKICKQKHIPTYELDIDQLEKNISTLAKQLNPRKTS